MFVSRIWLGKDPVKENSEKTCSYQGYYKMTDFLTALFLYDLLFSMIHFTEESEPKQDVSVIFRHIISLGFVYKLFNQDFILCVLRQICFFKC